MPKLRVVALVEEGGFGTFSGDFGVFAGGGFGLTAGLVVGLVGKGHEG